MGGYKVGYHSKNVNEEGAEVIRIRCESGRWRLPPIAAKLEAQFFDFTRSACSYNSTWYGFCGWPVLQNHCSSHNLRSRSFVDACTRWFILRLLQMPTLEMTWIGNDKSSIAHSGVMVLSRPTPDIWGVARVLQFAHEVGTRGKV